jgi:2'-5' RNA ligase
MDENYFQKNISDRRRSEYAVVIFLPHHLDELIAPLREKYDPLYNLVSAHLTLVFPFYSHRPLEELVGAVESVVSRTEPLVVELDSIGDFYPKSPCIYWSVRSNNDLTELYYGLYASLELPLELKEYTPHVTIAREISDHRVMIVKDTIASYLPSEKFEVEAVNLITPLAGQKWISVRTIPLSGLDFLSQ